MKHERAIPGNSPSLATTAAFGTDASGLECRLAISAGQATLRRPTQTKRKRADPKIRPSQLREPGVTEFEARCYQVLFLQPPSALPASEQVRVIEPLASLLIENELPDFDEATIV